MATTDRKAAPTARRLEQIRESFGFGTLKEFWEKLRTADDYRISYDAVRTYHQGRPAPASYLDRVARTFGVRLEWLIRGEPPMTEAERRVEVTMSERLEQLVAAHPELEQLSRAEQDQVLELLLQYQYQMPFNWVLWETDEGQAYRQELEEDLIFLLFLPQRAWGFKKLEELTDRERSSYVLGMISVLTLILRGVARGDGIGSHPGSLIPRLRRAAAGQAPEPSEDVLSAVAGLEKAIDVGGEAFKRYQEGLESDGLFLRPTGEEADVEP